MKIDIRMKMVMLILILVVPSLNISKAQSHTDQNGIKTSVINNLSTSSTQAQRFKIAEVCMNSHHWQQGGFIFVEFFCKYPFPGYEKYKIELGYGSGTQSSKFAFKLIESHCKEHHVKLEMGEVYSANTNYGGYVDVIVPIYVDVKYYSNYSIKLIYTLNKVDELSGINQIKVYDRPTVANISDFTAPVVDHSDENFAMKNGTVSGDFDVEGTIHATEIKVEAQTADFVFEPDYKLRPLNEVEAFVKTNKHLPEIPSAKQMETEGVNVAEMNKLLLQKVEELILYTIEQDKKLKELDALKKEMAFIKSMLTTNRNL